MGALYWTLGALASHWRRHPLQLFAVLTGLWLASGLWTGVQALNAQARDSYARASQLLGGERHYSLVARDGGRFSQQAFVELRRAGWPVSPLLQGRLQLPGHPRQRLQLIGLEPLTLPAGSGPFGQGYSADQLVQFLGPPGRTWIAP